MINSVSAMLQKGSDVPSPNPPMSHSYPHHAHRASSVRISVVEGTLLLLLTVVICVALLAL